MTEATHPPGRTFWTDRRISLVLAVILFLFGGYEASRLVTSQNNGDTLQEIRAQTQLIRNATNPNSPAAKRGAAATAAAVGSINETTIIAVYCGNKGGDVATIRACVQAEFLKLSAVNK